MFILEKQQMLKLIYSRCDICDILFSHHHHPFVTHRHRGVFRISKRGAKFSLATSAHTKEGANQVFQFIFNVKKLG